MDSSYSEKTMNIYRVRKRDLYTGTIYEQRALDTGIKV